MSDNPSICAIIPARGGSKRLPRKNVLPLAGKPLIAHSIEHAQEAGFFDRIIVCTEDEEIAQVGKQFGAEVIERPQSLAEDTTPTLPVMQFVLNTLAKEGYQPDIVVLLQPTSPLRKPQHLREGLQLLLEKNADSVFGVKRSKVSLNWLFTIENEALTFVAPKNMDQIRSQDLSEAYVINGALYIYKRETVETAEKYAMGDRCVPLIMDAASSTDIDEALDFKIAEFLLHERAQDRR